MEFRQRLGLFDRRKDRLRFSGKSIGHGITTVTDLENDEQVWPVILELTQDIGHKLRVHGLSAEGVALHIRDNTLYSKQWQTKMDMPTQSPMIIAKAAYYLFERNYAWRNQIRSVTVQAINLVPQDTPRQIGLFMDTEKWIRWKDWIGVLKKSGSVLERTVLGMESFSKHQNAV